MLPMSRVDMATRKLVQTISAVLPIVRLCSQRLSFPKNERKWVVIPANPSFGGALSTQVSKMVARMVRHDDQEEREPDGSYHWHTARPVLLKAFGKHGALKFPEDHWIRLIQAGSSKKELNTVWITKKSLGLPFEPLKDTLVVFRSCRN